MKISELIAENIELTPEQAHIADELIPVRQYRKGSILLEEGEVATESYFNIKGCVRSYHIIDGDERTTAFFVEGDAISSHTSYLNQTPASHYLACVEDCTLAVLSYENDQELFRLIPELGNLCRVNMEQEFGKQQEVLANYLTKNPEERYLLLMETKPELLQRVPQYHLASFIGVQPESLSRIRKRLAKRS